MIQLFICQLVIREKRKGEVRSYQVRSGDVGQPASQLTGNKKEKGGGGKLSNQEQGWWGVDS